MTLSVLLALSLVAPGPRACVHDIDSPRPRVTRAEQRRVRAIIDRVSDELGVHADFRRLLHLVAERESSNQAGLVHRMGPDVAGSFAAWRKMSSKYTGNPYAADPDLWQTYGLFGMNSNYFTMLWDRRADPRVLCDPIVDVLVYRRAAVRAVRKLSGPVQCVDEQGQRFTYRPTPTWATVHRAVSGGKICPSRREARAATMRRYFEARARRHGLDPDAEVSVGMLGREPVGQPGLLRAMRRAVWAGG